MESHVDNKLQDMMQDFMRGWEQATGVAEAAEEAFGPDGKDGHET